MSLPKETADLCDAVEAHIKALEARIATLEAEEARLLTDITTLRGRVELEQRAKDGFEALYRSARAEADDLNTKLTAALVELDSYRAAQGGSQ